MIQCDSRLLELSKRPFPSLDSPFFYSNLLYEAALRYSQGYDLCELVTNPASHHQPALVSSTQQVEQFGKTLPSSLTYSTPPPLSSDVFIHSYSVTSSYKSHIKESCHLNMVFKSRESPLNLDHNIDTIIENWVMEKGLPY